MIGKDLPAGTRIQFLPLPDGSHGDAGKPGLVVWGIYTIRDYMAYPTGGNVGVRLVEFRNVMIDGIEWGLALSRFRVVQPLPASITDCLNVRQTEPV